ncbi:biotin carboxyl carrier protein of acetyl-CoA carboxylase 1, chloroplastic-like [Iris pallida]|uniref:Biotin carboxyl carrier protein of acetyl-CoA carboxylase n=1 Tax=Iris pallida TaxID=29817 RepID=A0AAX6HWA1_IRIPA|nr:biotin carboxyl carrier protein of acetyl-CoA carboxylase 1, chloroplastic-like [Iris pallida]KAJ6844817.1 biotin carboxyl carrier protein of acetyl-CoA carboxylase 1, chloroplastic-like [Iris pallida]
MASISLPCPKCSVAGPRVSPSRPNWSLKQLGLSVRGSKPPPFLGRYGLTSRSESLNRIDLPILRAQVHEAAAIDGSSKSSTLVPSKLESPPSDGNDAESVEGSDQDPARSESYITSFMAEVSDLVKLVDSRDIMELKLKKGECELIIRKKAAFAQLPPTAPIGMMQPSQQYMHLPQAPTPQPIPAAAPSPAIPVPSKTSKSTLPSLKCPMAGTFYRCPAPGEPPFVKVGDKVQKGQVVCIIEAMKLMNEIEADQSGTVVDILAEDGKAVSVDMPLLVIQP